jgi:uncharacterized RmlC-like cupin family protein
MQKRVTVQSARHLEPLDGAQGQFLTPTVVQAMNGSTGISACEVVMDPGKVARMHLHERNEIIVVVVEGFAATLTGPEMTPNLHGPGDFLYVPDGVIHTAVNLSPDHRLVAWEFRTDPHLNEDVVLTPELTERMMTAARELQQSFAAGTLEVPGHWDRTNFSPYTR